MAGEASASEANLHPSGGVLAQPPRSVVATVQTRGLGRTELRRRAGDRVGYEGSYQATQSSIKTLGVGSFAETAEASEAHFCLPPLRNGAISQSPTSPKTIRNSPNFAVVCQPNVRSRHHSAPFRTVSEGVFSEVGGTEELKRYCYVCF